MQSHDAGIEATLRPKHLADFIGQTRVKENIEIAIQAARARGEALDHVLLYGPPGLGKTTLAQIIAIELGVAIKTSSGPAITRKADMLAMLTRMGRRDVLFIDEIHRLEPPIEEFMYPALEDRRLDIIVGPKIVKFSLNPFTLVGATTRPSLVTSPLRTRFGIVCRLELYTSEELATIIRASAAILNVAINDDAAMELAKRSRGTPRIANHLLRRSRDYAQVASNGRITLDAARQSCDAQGIDANGLDQVDRKIILTLLQKKAPIGLSTLAACVGEDENAIEDVYEPYLIQSNMLERTPRGRVATELAREFFSCKSTRAA
jgi:Holliday junction DNA helicase RuvB